MEKDKAKRLIITAVAIVLIAIAVGIIFVNKELNKIKSESGKAGGGQEAGSNAEQVAEAEGNSDPDIVIKSTLGNKIEKDGIEAKEIKLKVLGDQLEVKTTLKNNGKEDMDGYDVTIELVDASGNVVSTISDNSTEKVKAGATVDTVSYVAGLENPSAITSARIKELTKTNARDKLDETVESMKPEI